MKKKKVLKIGALVLAILLIGGVCVFANSLVGNPISKALARHTAEKHLEEVYGGKDYELERVTYSFKDGYYHARVSSPTSMDTHFVLLINGFGQLKYDYFENNVTNGWNTAYRLGGEYRKAVKAVFDSASFPFRVHISYGDLEFVPADQKDAHFTPDYALITNELVPDAYYNVSELGKRAGKLTAYIADDTVSAERMAEILLGIRACFDDAGIGFYAIDCVLEYERDANGFAEDDTIKVEDFRYADIYEDGLIDRVTAANEAAMEEEFSYLS